MREQILVIIIELGVALLILGIIMWPITAIAHQEEPKSEIYCIGNCK